MENTNEDIGQVSKYNDAGLSISRLNDSWILCKQYIRRGNFRMWKIELDNIWLELVTDVIRSNNKEKLFKRNNLLMENIAKSKNRNGLFFNLMARHCFLREVQDIAGKAGVYIDEDDEAFD